jgi:hypothetical protein
MGERTWCDGPCTPPCRLPLSYRALRSPLSLPTGFQGTIALASPDATTAGGGLAAPLPTSATVHDCDGGNGVIHFHPRIRFGLDAATFPSSVVQASQLGPTAHVHQGGGGIGAATFVYSSDLTP